MIRQIACLARHSLLLAIVSLTLLACSTSDKWVSSDVPLPADTNIVSPSDREVPQERVAWLGKWVGVYDNALDHTLIVEEVNQTHAKTIYAFGIAPKWGVFKPRWYRVRGEFMGDSLRILGIAGARVTYRMLGPNHLEAVYESHDIRSIAQMMRGKR